MKQQGLTKTSRTLQWTIMALWLLTLGIAVLRWTATHMVAWLPPTLAAQVGDSSVSTGIRLACFGVELIPLAAAYYALAALYRICGAYGRGEIFRLETGILYRRFGRGLLLLGAANALYTSLLSALLSFAVQGKLAISVGLSTADLYLLIVGCAVQMLGMVMDEAYRLQAENNQII
ncbi:MAG: DUF2975 domain-containing protein [Trichlorobacter sp.]|uniref:DUF2975 domain-containing protein n=1 Tax=Trichlorobacter sp. TaxID=2911007 RepID=UPI00255F0E00|nr:DUF2975 domain-containing protein [Trichlorobacter sp.]MDK9716880.1 DUF2975 domain-containing protein [Trichlorobacter sp.]